MIDQTARYDLVNELHARPFAKCDGPHRISHYAFTHSTGDPEKDRDHINELCRRFGATPPAPGAIHHLADLGQFRLKWELHTEFSTYTFFRAGVFEDPFEGKASDLIPDDWLQDTPGELVVALDIALATPEIPEPSHAQLEEYFVDQGLVVSTIANGRGRLWTDFRLHKDGHGRMLVRNDEMSGFQAGRLVQRLIEIETYYILALLALPIARDAAAKLPRIDADLAHLTLGLGPQAAAASREESSDAADDKATDLRRLTRLSAEIETLATTTAFRFGASDAYYAIVRTRVSELREERVEGYQTLSEFLERRLAPAMRTCVSVARRIDDLSRRAGRTSDLMRTQVDVSIQAQNMHLLESMNHRAQLQLRLQQTVEGLSVAAISYYAVGLIGYFAKGLTVLGLSVKPEIVQGIAAPLVILAAWLLLRRFRKYLERPGD